MDKEFLQRQFERLGEMMGDGLHHEKDGKWITKEYKRIMKILYPEIFKEQRRLKNQKIDKQVQKIIDNPKSRCKCGGKFRQSRSGSIVLYCINCNARYKCSKKSK